MDGVGAGGLVLGIIPLLIFGLESYYSHATVRHNDVPYKQRVQEYGVLVTWILYAFFADAFTIMDRVECQIRCADEKHTVAFIRSQTSSFNMIGIAGAIIAQVAISAMSLTEFGTSHWTIHAFFIASLVTGCLSVFFSCSISLTINNLHSASDIKDFLFLSNTSTFRKEITIRNLNTTEPPNEEKLTSLSQLLQQEQWTLASPHAATMLVVPRLGVYLGMLYDGELKHAYGAWIGVLAFYVFSAVSGIACYYVPRHNAHCDGARGAKWWRMVGGREGGVREEGVREAVGKSARDEDGNIVQKSDLSAVEGMFAYVSWPRQYLSSITASLER
ncbi:hypothetical protein T440DRAFT_478780 [Plenodomus tracheiphilus IPT5]|uniref:Uncharacterized protein n=1 Tax=Plenodomus tracheiphilus IPT5 TaxID=1408161 RepID=A0A6A7B5V7_9PLEO|nr:hypothetical protein T440DRAFT_478780 [Plenodomus tracheiphilus IPT5]